MITFDTDGIYNLLPAWIRLKDQEAGGGALRALMSVIASQAELLEDNLDELYDDQFIETCQTWVIPYIGELIGFRPLRPLGPGKGSATRAEVANTIGYRRRKGTLGVLEELAFDVTGWPAIAVEYFARLATTQYVRSHVRLQNAIVDVRSPVTALDIAGAFDLPPRSADVRRIASGRGRYNIPNIGVFVWRLATFGGAAQVLQRPTSLERSTARLVAANRYTFDPFGGDVPLINPPRPLQLFSLAGRMNVPFPLQRYSLYYELETARAAKAAGQTPHYVFLADPPVFTVYEADGAAIQPEAIAICDLTAWTPPTEAGIRVSVDPVLGRFVFAAPAPAAGDHIRVSYAYSFSGNYGGGSYPRTPDPGEAAPSVHIADFAAANLAAIPHGVAEIDDSGILAGDAALSPDSASLTIRAGDYARPVITGSLTVNAVTGASVTLRGIGIGGGLTLAGSGPISLSLEHCTVRGQITWSIAGGGLLRVDHSLCGPLAIDAACDLNIADSVVDAGSDAGAAISGGGGAAAGSVTIARSTIFGALSARELPLVENSILTGAATSARRQEGCVRYTYLPTVSLTPQRYRCQPEASIDAAIAKALEEDPSLSKPARDAIAAGIAAWLVPSFTSREPGTPGYAQLADFAPDAIRYGAEDGDEMGVFFALFGPRREANLGLRVREYIRIALEFGVIHAS
jgi:hypothetical protein